MKFAGCAGIHVDFIASSDLSRRNLTVKPGATEWRVLQSHIWHFVSVGPHPERGTI
jgi:hypothetical protein